MPETAEPGSQGGLRVYLRWREAPFALVLPAGTSCEILLETRPAPIPGAPDWVRGRINRQGSVVPVLTLPNAWSDAEGDDQEQLLVIVQGRQQLALQTMAQPDFAPVSSWRGAEPESSVPAELSGESPIWHRLDAEQVSLGLEWDPLVWASRRRA